MTQESRMGILEDSQASCASLGAQGTGWEAPAAGALGKGRKSRTEWRRGKSCGRSGLELALGHGAGLPSQSPAQCLLWWGLQGTLVQADPSLNVVLLQSKSCGSLGKILHLLDCWFPH